MRDAYRLLAIIAAIVFLAALGRCKIRDSICEHIQWSPSRLPISVRVDGSAALWEPFIASALAWWGPEFIVLNELGGDVVIYADRDQSGGHADVRISPTSCRIIFAEIHLPKQPGIAGAHIVAHELGHALGLPHVGDEWSIMNPSVRQPSLVAHDKEELRRAYGRIPWCVSP